MTGYVFMDKHITSTPSKLPIENNMGLIACYIEIAHEN